MKGGDFMPQKSKRGFAAMSKDKQKEIARKGGKASRGRKSNKDTEKAGLSDLVGF